MQWFEQSFYNRHHVMIINHSFFVLYFDESSLDYPHQMKSHFPSGLKIFRKIRFKCQGSFFNCEAEDRQYFYDPLGDNYDIRLSLAPLQASQMLDLKIDFNFFKLNLSYCECLHFDPVGQNPTSQFGHITLRTCRLLQFGPCLQNPRAYHGHSLTFEFGSMCKY